MSVKIVPAPTSLVWNFWNELCRSAGFHPIQGRVENITKTQENRAQGKLRHRVWVQGVYEKRE